MFSGRQDDLIDVYNQVQLPEDFDMKEDGNFMRGYGIGSGIFKRLLKDNVEAG